MTGKRRRTGLWRTAIAVALAMALLGPGPTGSPTPGGDTGSRSTPASPDLLMVNVNETTCLALATVGGVFAGTSGGGIAHWTTEGSLLSVHTTAVGGLLSNHIVDLATGIGSSYAITSSPEPLVFATGSGGNGWSSLGPVAGANGPLRSLRGGDQLLVIDDLGRIFTSQFSVSWKREDLPAGIPDEGWKLADVEGDTLVLSNGTGIVVVDLQEGDHFTIKTPPVTDLDLESDKVAIASHVFPNVYDLSTSSWLDRNVTEAIASNGNGWVRIEVEQSKFTAVTFDGIVVEVEIKIPSSAGDVKLLGSLPDDLDANVTDMMLLANETVLLSTLKGNWVVVEGDARPFTSSHISMPRSNDIRSVRWEGDALWTLTPEGVSMLTFDSPGLPEGWIDGPDLEKGERLGLLDSAVLGGTVYLAGAGDGIITYDTFASSKPSRWNRTHVYGDGLRDDVRAVAVMGGRLYTGGPYGVDMMSLGSDPPSFQPVEGAPKDVHCLYLGTGGFWAGTDTGLWNYNSYDEEWLLDRGLGEPLPEGPILDYIGSNGFPYATMEGILWWLYPDFGSGSKTLSHTDNITRLAARPDVDDPSPIWATVGGKGIAYVQDEAMEYYEPGRERMGHAIVRDVAVGPDGTAYLATDSGLHRVAQYRTTWFDWTTSNGLSANDIRALEMRPFTDELWVGAYGGVDVLDTATWETTRIGTEDGIPSNQVYDILIANDEVWVGTDVGGAARARLGTSDWQVYNMSTGLVADDVQAVEIVDDLVLFGTDEGVTVLDLGDSTLSTHTVSSTSGGLPGNWVWCTLLGNDKIFVGTDRGLGLYNPGTDTFHAFTSEDIAGQAVRSLGWGPEGTLWVGTDCGLVVLPLSPRTDMEAEGTLDRSSGLPGDEVLSIHMGSDDMMWLGTSAGVALVDADLGVHATFTTNDGLVHDRVNAIAEHPTGTMWLGTAGGLSRLMKERWKLLLQWVVVQEDLPDVYITLDSIQVTPDEPNAGDPVLVEVNVANPSSKRAIVHVGLFMDDNGTPGTEVSSAIAYTDPGSTYDVTLEWTARGGEWTFWVVLDPDGLVPESNERNNHVALTVIVNHSPEILKLEVFPPTGLHEFPNPSGYVMLGFVYRDLDGDWPTYIEGRVVETDLTETFSVPGGDPREGLEVGTGFKIPMGNSTIVIQMSDGSTMVNASIRVDFNFAIDISGIESGRSEDGTLRFNVEALQPWEGETIDGVEVWFVGLGTDPRDPSNWIDSMFKAATMDGDEWSYDASQVPSGTYDVWVLAMDDRLAQALFVEEGVTVEDVAVVDEADWALWGLLSVIVLVAVAMAFIGTRPRRVAP